MPELPEVETVLGFKRKDNDDWDFMIDPTSKIGYARVTSFSRNTARDLLKVMRELVSSGVKGFVLDLMQKSGPLAILSITNNALPTLLDVERFENPGVDVIFDGGHLPAGPRTTVINVSDDGMELVREGAISRESLQKVSPDNFAKAD